MLRNFQEIKDKIKSVGARKVAVAVAEDEEVLLALREAQDEGLAHGLLVGDEDKIKKIAKEHKISLEGFEIFNELDQQKAAEKACELVRSGKASVIMKGLLDTSKFMKAILNKERGLNAGNLLSHIAVYELPTYPKFLMLTDAAINIAPDLPTKAKMIQNAVDFSHSLGYSKPLVACCSAVEKVNDAMPSTLDCALLAKMNDRGQIKGCIVDGPFGLDNAVSEESARIKGIVSPVAGKADIILANNIESANYLYKALNFLCQGAKSGAVVAGAACPIVLTSRADTHETKLLSILLAVLSSSFKS